MSENNEQRKALTEAEQEQAVGGGHRKSTWTCPKCRAENDWTLFVCDECGYNRFYKE